MTLEITPETQASIAKWAQDTFGPVSAPRVLIERAQLELDELLEALTTGDVSQIGAETADVLIILYRLLEMYGLDTQVEVTQKMQKNRARCWRTKGDGTGSHIK